MDQGRRQGRRLGDTDGDEAGREAGLGHPDAARHRDHPVSSVVPVFTSSRSASDAWAPKARTDAPSVRANSSWLVTLAPSSRARREGEVASWRALVHAADTNGQILRRSPGRATATSPPITPMTTAATPIQISVLVSELVPDDRLSGVRSMSLSGITISSTSAWTMNPLNPSIDPWVSATARSTPWRSR